MPLQKLYTIPLGSWGTVQKVCDESPIHDRLIQLGFEPEARVCRMYTDAAAFLSAYRIENTLIALRRCDADAVLVEV